VEAGEKTFKLARPLGNLWRTFKPARLSAAADGVKKKLSNWPDQAVELNRKKWPPRIYCHLSTILGKN
jgi:hypothetical protein